MENVFQIVTGLSGFVGIIVRGHGVSRTTKCSTLTKLEVVGYWDWMYEGVSKKKLALFFSHSYAVILRSTIKHPEQLTCLYDSTKPLLD